MGLIVPLGPVDAEGLRFDRPASQRKWAKLQNISLRDGSWVPRPGFKSVGNLGEPWLPATEPSATIFIGEIQNPGDTAEGREGYTWSVETLRPDGSSDIIAGWSGSHTDIDDTVPDDGSTTLSTSTEGAQKSITFGNLSGSYGPLLGYMVRGRARTAVDGEYATLNFYSRSGSTNVLIGSARIGATDAGSEVNDWIEFGFFVGGNVHASGDCTLSSTNINALNIVIELDSSGTFVAEHVLPAADGTHTEWVDTANGGVATYTDFLGKPHLVNGAEVGSELNYITSNGEGSRQSFTITPNITFSSIDSVVLTAGFIKDAQADEPNIQLTYWDSGGTEYPMTHRVGPTAASSTASSKRLKHGVYCQSVYTNDTTNPADDAAWEQADLTGGEFGVKLVDGPNVTVDSFSVDILGQTSGSGTVYVDYIAVEVVGATTSAPADGLVDFTRLWSTNKTHMRLDRDYRSAVDNVTNSVPLSSSPPVLVADSAVLYGQIYVVNGMDATRRYPNSSDVYEALTTNNADGATAITGRTIAAFADRILYGWVKDNTTVTPERIAYSKRYDGGTHADTTTFSSGDFDLIDTPGGVEKLIVLNEDICVALKGQGVYALRQSGLAQAPIIPEPISYDVGIIAPATAKRMVDQDGTTVILFLGYSASFGYNVFRFDGATVIPIGDPVRPILRDDVSHCTLRLAFAEVEPESGAYWLFVPYKGQLSPTRAFAYHPRGAVWTGPQEFPFNVTCAGIWHIATPHMSDATSTNDSLLGSPKMIISGVRGIPLYGDFKFNADEQGQANDDQDFDDINLFQDFGGNSGGAGKQNQVMTSIMETGDLVLPENRHVLSYRLHVIYRCRTNAVHLLVDASEDGGVSWNTQIETWLGSPNGGVDKSTRHDILDLTPLNSKFARYRLTFDPLITEDTEWHLAKEQLWQIDDMWLEAEVGGDDP